MPTVSALKKFSPSEKPVTGSVRPSRNSARKPSAVLSSTFAASLSGAANSRTTEKSTKAQRIAMPILSVRPM